VSKESPTAWKGRQAASFVHVSIISGARRQCCQFIHVFLCVLIMGLGGQGHEASVRRSELLACCVAFF